METALRQAEQDPDADLYEPANVRRLLRISKKLEDSKYLATLPSIADITRARKNAKA